MGTLEEQNVPDYLCGESQWETAENTQLYKAASAGDCQKLCDALEKGANPNYYHKQEDHAFTLHAVARSSTGSDKGAALCAKELIRKGASVSSALISNRNEPIHEAANVGAKDVCQVLIDASPECAESVNAFGNTALHAATRSGSADVVKLLLDRGSDPNKKNHRGSSALHVACFLASVGKEMPSPPAGDDLDPYLKIGAILLCNYRVEIDICDVNGYTPLHIAAQRGCDEMVKLLIDSGASLTAKTGIDSKGRGARTPAGMAVFGAQNSTVKILEDAMAADHGDVVTKTMARRLVPDSWKY